MFRNKNGFTLVELLTVIVILGVLVLIAVPKFTGYVESAKTAQIKADIKTYENAIGIKTIDNGNFTEKWGEVSSSQMDTYNRERKLYSKKGLMKEGDSFEKTYKKVKKDDVPVSSNLEGDFILDSDGEVFYYNNLAEANSSNPVEPGDPAKEKPPVANDLDFTWVETYSGYNVASKTSKGYYKYKGTETKITIPEKINGDTLTSYYKMFDGSSNMEQVASTAEVTSTASMFSAQTNLGQTVKIDLTGLNMASVTKINSMFENSAYYVENFSSWDTSKVEYAEYTFLNNSVEKTNFNTLKTPSLIKADYMFFGSTGTSIDLSNWKLDNLKTISSMFKRANYESINLSNPSISSLERIDSLFSEAKIDSIKMDINTSKVTTMQLSFGDLTSKNGSAVNLDFLSKWDTSNVIDISGMFKRAKLESLPISNWNTSNLSTLGFTQAGSGNSEPSGGAFEGLTLSNIPIQDWDVSNVTNMSNAFKDTSATTIDISKWKPTNLKFMVSMFENSKVSKLDFSNWISNNAGMNRAFYNTPNLTELDASKFTLTGNYEVFNKIDVKTVKLSDYDNFNSYFEFKMTYPNFRFVN